MGGRQDLSLSLPDKIMGWYETLNQVFFFLTEIQGYPTTNKFRKYGQDSDGERSPSKRFGAFV
jgi:hypothetical protein